MEINGILITHPEKIVYPEAKINKTQVAEYYNYIADYLLPYIKNRPLSVSSRYRRVGACPIS